VRNARCPTCNQIIAFQTKICNTCKKSLPISSFGNDRCRGDGLDCRCLKCGSEQRRKRIALRYNAPPQPDICECCGKKTKKLNLDHCHDTEKFRGWLCHNCNTGIGLLGDKSFTVEMAVKYLKNTEMMLTE
jgi:hypothetical protein